jgi:hypothetical protein
MPRKRRSNEVFTMSFLDTIACGFGATVLVYLIISASSHPYSHPGASRTLAEVRLLERDVADGRQDLVELRNTLEELERRVVEARGRGDDADVQVRRTREELARFDAEALSRTSDVEKLKSDVEALEKELERLRAAASEQGTSARSFAGEGSRQYLTGLKLGGDRVLFLLDTSASMLDETIVNVIRRRNMDPARRQQAPKWQRALATVEWLAAQLDVHGRFQVYAFDAGARSILAGTDGQWQEVIGGDRLDAAITALKQLVPGGGSSLENAFAAVAGLDPLPDNIYLITDSLPTLAEKPGRDAVVSARDRLEYFNDAVEELPGGIPVNVVLLPFEGDPMAASAYWKLAVRTGGSYIAPASDWP